jgi:hypothetical protein
MESVKSASGNDGETLSSSEEAIECCRVGLEYGRIH